MTSVTVALALSLISALSYSAAAILQERSAATSASNAVAPLRNGHWWASLLLNGAGAALHAVALACGALNMVQPLGASTIVFTILMASFVNHRRVGATGWRGTALTVAGLAGLLLLATSHHHAGLPAGSRRILAGVGLVGVAGCVIGARRSRRPKVRGVALAVAAGVSFGLASVFTKLVAGDWASPAPSTDPLSLAAIVVLSMAGLYLSQRAYREAGLAGPLATLTVANPATATMVGMAAFGETFRLGITGAVLAAGAALITMLGLRTLTRLSITGTSTDASRVVAISVPAQEGSAIAMR